jgi:hypothetical protein
VSESRGKKTPKKAPKADVTTPEAVAPESSELDAATKRTAARKRTPAKSAGAAATATADTVTSTSTERPTTERTATERTATERTATERAAAPTVTDEPVAPQQAVLGDGRAESTPDDIDAYEFIRTRAYHLFRERGGAPGYELEDWVRAEREYRDHSGR